MAYFLVCLVSFSCLFSLVCDTWPACTGACHAFSLRARETCIQEPWSLCSFACLYKKNKYYKTQTIRKNNRHLLPVCVIISELHQWLIDLSTHNHRMHYWMITTFWCWKHLLHSGLLLMSDNYLLYFCIQLCVVVVVVQCSTVGSSVVDKAAAAGHVTAALLWANHRSPGGIVGSAPQVLVVPVVRVLLLCLSYTLCERDEGALHPSCDRSEVRHVFVCAFLTTAAGYFTEGWSVFCSSRGLYEQPVRHWQAASCVWVW